MSPINVLWINKEIMTVYHSVGVIICKSTDEFNRMVLQEKKNISEREYILDRYEPWEVDDLKSLKNLLVSRARNANEKNLVMKYMSHMKQE